MNEHALVTEVKNPKAETPKSEPLVAPKDDKGPLCDPRAIFISEPIEREDVTVGDWVSARSWTRPRRVMAMEEDVMFLADPDNSRTNDHGIRRLDSAGWEKRGAWRCFPNLRAIWEAAHSPCNS